MLIKPVVSKSLMRCENPRELKDRGYLILISLKAVAGQLILSVRYGGFGVVCSGGGTTHVYSKYPASIQGYKQAHADATARFKSKSARGYTQACTGLVPYHELDSGNCLLKHLRGEGLQPSPAHVKTAGSRLVSVLAPDSQSENSSVGALNF